MAYKQRTKEHDCPYCPRSFLRETSLEQHCNAMHPNGGIIWDRKNTKAPAANTQPPANTNTPTMQTAAAARTPDHNNANPKEHFIIDFLTPNTNLKCSGCGVMGAVPLTRKCPLCDPLLISMAATANTKAAEDQARAERASTNLPARIIGGVAESAASLFRGRGDNDFDLGERGFGAYDH